MDDTAEVVIIYEDVGEDHSFTYEAAWLADAGVTEGCNPPDTNSP